MSDKLPEWPKKPWGAASENIWAHYYNDTAEAALARMEALVGYAEHAYGCEKCPADGYGWKVPMPDDTTECTCGLSELLAACERR